MYYSLDELVVGKLEYGSGASAIPYDGKTRYIRITDIDDDGNLNKEPMTPSEIDEKYLLNDGDVLFARTGATVGKTYRYIPADGKCIYAGYLIRAIPNQRLIRPDYLWLFTKSPQYWQFVRNSMKVVAQPNINAKQYGSIIINVPSLEEQDTILSALLNILDVINKRKKQLHAFDTLIKARFVEMFGDPIHNSEHLPVLPMTEVCEIIDGDRGKNYPKQEEFFDDEYCLFLNAKNVTSHGFDFSECMYITREKDMALRKGKLQRGDVVLTTRGTLGNLAFYTDDVPYENVRINSGMVILRMNRGMIDEGFFIEQFRMQVDDIKKTIASGSAQPQLPISTMNKINILVPDLTRQRSFAAYVSQVDKSKVVVQAALEKAQLLFDSLMQQYFG